MVNIPARFGRMAVAFDEMSRDRSFESGSSEHSADLSDLVNSFFEREIREQRIGGDGDRNRNPVEIDDDEFESDSQDSGFHDCLSKLFDRDDSVGRSISTAVEKAMEVVGGEDSSPEFNRRCCPAASSLTLTLNPSTSPPPSRRPSIAQLRSDLVHAVRERAQKVCLRHHAVELRRWPSTASRRRLHSSNSDTGFCTAYQVTLYI
ncbi:hypothetical protein SASPL_120301 [Salvia splendens]|uniref:Uncharacterized protein n=1 Tax=Salvia splendens TaxID=180675 RepID=A0A8X8XSP7_SALSN|nr:hypothetical protein SASPL_120301 [Salvia splendens]